MTKEKTRVFLFLAMPLIK